MLEPTSLIRLLQIINPALDFVTVDNIRKFARKAQDYEQAYREGHKAGKAVEDAVKVYICTKKPAHFTASAHSRTRSPPEESLALPTMLLAFCAEVQCYSLELGRT